jgi:hypothetical protein
MKRFVLTNLVAVVVACLLGAAPAGATSLSIGMRTDNLHLGIRIGEAPRLVVVPGTPVYEAPGLPYNYFVYHGRYYLYRDGYWFRARYYDGPWTVIAIEQVPRPILRVPAEQYRERPGHWAHHGPPPWAQERERQRHGYQDHHHGRG